MAQIVEEVRARPPAPVDSERQAAPVDTGTGTGLLSPDGRSFTRVEREIGPGRAVTLLHAGALVAWDFCGCGGYCGFDWLDAERRHTLLRAGPPKIGGRAGRGRWGVVGHWRGDDGSDLILAKNHVRWGHELA